MVNLALALFFLAFLVPIAVKLPDLATSVQVLLVILGLFFGLLTVLCLASALRPGSIGRFARRLR